MNDLRFSADCGPDEFLSRLSEVRVIASAPDLVVRIERGRTGDRAGLFVALSALVSARLIDGKTTRVEQHGDDGPRPWDRTSLPSTRPGTGLSSSAESPPFACEHIRDLRTARRLAEAHADALEQHVPALSASVLRMARFVFEELGANIVQHSGRAGTGFGVLHVRAPEQRLEIAFADRGVGFRASLQRHPELEGRVPDDGEALQLALTPRVTGTSTPRSNMGIGLALLVQFADLLGGELWIASGTVALQRKTTASGARANVLRSIAGWPGAWIALDAPLA